MNIYCRSFLTRSSRHRTQQHVQSGKVKRKRDRTTRDRINEPKLPLKNFSQVSLSPRLYFVKPESTFRQVRGKNIQPKTQLKRFTVKLEISLWRRRLQRVRRRRKMNCLLDLILPPSKKEHVGKICNLTVRFFSMGYI